MNPYANQQRDYEYKIESREAIYGIYEKLLDIHPNWSTDILMQMAEDMFINMTTYDDPRDE